MCTAASAACSPCQIAHLPHAASDGQERHPDTGRRYDLFLVRTASMIKAKGICKSKLLQLLLNCLPVSRV